MKLILKGEEIEKCQIENHNNLNLLLTTVRVHFSESVNFLKRSIFEPKFYDWIWLTMPIDLSSLQFYTFYLQITVFTKFLNYILFSSRVSTTWSISRKSFLFNKMEIWTINCVTRRWRISFFTFTSSTTKCCFWITSKKTKIHRFKSFAWFISRGKWSREGIKITRFEIKWWILCGISKSEGQITIRLRDKKAQGRWRICNFIWTGSWFKIFEKSRKFLKFLCRLSQRHSES